MAAAARRKPGGSLAICLSLRRRLALLPLGIRLCGYRAVAVCQALRGVRAQRKGYNTTEGGKHSLRAACWPVRCYYWIFSECPALHWQAAPVFTLRVGAVEGGKVASIVGVRLAGLGGCAGGLAASVLPSSEADSSGLRAAHGCSQRRQGSKHSLCAVCWPWWLCCWTSSE